MNVWGTKIVTAWVVCSLIIAGGLIFTLSRPAADALVHEPGSSAGGIRLLTEAMDIGPSPFVLLIMGGLGIGCVLINERRRRRDLSPQMPHSPAPRARQQTTPGA
jgi:hypothetical protein